MCSLQDPGMNMGRDNGGFVGLFHIDMEIRREIHFRGEEPLDKLLLIFSPSIYLASVCKYIPCSGRNKTD